jgi:hypothetical protein
MPIAAVYTEIELLKSAKAMLLMAGQMSATRRRPRRSLRRRGFLRRRHGLHTVRQSVGHALSRAARLVCINWLADTSEPAGAGFGLMVNYLYDLDHIEMQSLRPHWRPRSGDFVARAPATWWVGFLPEFCVSRNR